VAFSPAVKDTALRSEQALSGAASTPGLVTAWMGVARSGVPQREAALDARCCPRRPLPPPHCGPDEGFARARTRPRASNLTAALPRRHRAKTCKTWCRAASRARCVREPDTLCTSSAAATRGARFFHRVLGRCPRPWSRPRPHPRHCHGDAGVLAPDAARGCHRPVIGTEDPRWPRIDPVTAGRVRIVTPPAALGRIVSRLRRGTRTRTTSGPARRPELAQRAARRC
jgi:hypothetical protein